MLVVEISFSGCVRMGRVVYLFIAFVSVRLVGNRPPLMFVREHTTRTYEVQLWINVNNKDPPPGQRAFLKTNTKTCLLQPPAPLPLASHETLGLGLEAPGEHAARDNEDGYLKD